MDTRNNKKSSLGSNDYYCNHYQQEFALCERCSSTQLYLPIDRWKVRKDLETVSRSSCSGNKLKLKLVKLKQYHNNIFRFLWAREDSNLRHGVYKTPVLAAELLARICLIIPLMRVTAQLVINTDYL